MKNLRNTFPGAAVRGQRGMSGVPVVGGTPQFTPNDIGPKRIVL